jgi:hypothetical protein
MKKFFTFIILLILNCQTQQQTQTPRSLIEYSRDLRPLAKEFGKQIYIIDPSNPKELEIINFKESGEFYTTLKTYKDCNNWQVKHPISSPSNREPNRNYGSNIFILSCGKHNLEVNLGLYHLDNRNKEYDEDLYKKTKENDKLDILSRDNKQNFISVTILQDNVFNYLGFIGKEKLEYYQKEVESKINKNNDELLKFYGNIKKDSILDISDSKNYTDFYIHHLNKNTNPNLYYTWNIDGDEFDTKKKVNEASYIKKYKYITQSFDNEEFNINDYNFAKGGFEIYIYSKYWDGDNNGFKLVNGKTIFLKIKENLAKSFKNNNQNLRLDILAIPDFKINSENVYECKENGILIKAVNEDFYQKMYAEDPYVAKKGCKKEIGKFKKLDYNIINFKFINIKTGEVYWK